MAVCVYVCVCVCVCESVCGSVNANVSVLFVHFVRFAAFKKLKHNLLDKFCEMCIPKDNFSVIFHSWWFEWVGRVCVCVWFCPFSFHSPSLALLLHLSLSISLSFSPSLHSLTPTHSLQPRYLSNFPWSQSSRAIIAPHRVLSHRISCNLRGILAVFCANFKIIIP